MTETRVRSTRPNALAAVLAVAAAAIVGSATAQPTTVDDEPGGILPIPDYGGRIDVRSRLITDQSFDRTGLAERGVQFDAELMQSFQGVVSGGLDETGRYGAHAQVLATFDLMRMDLVPGALVTIRAESRFGDSINGRTGALLPAATDQFFPLTRPTDEDVAFAVTELTWLQLFSESFGLIAGKLNTLGGDPNEFASGRGRTQFGNARLVFNPVTALSVPYASLGAGAVWLPTSDATVTASILNTADASTTTGFDDFGAGWTLSIEGGFRHEINGLPGGWNIGALYAGDGDFVQVNGRFVLPDGAALTIPRGNDSWSAYASAWQYLWTDGGDAPIDPGNGIVDRRGIGVFLRAGVGDDDTLPIDWHLSGGLGGRGPLPGRPDDAWGLGVWYDAIQPDRLTAIPGVENDAYGVEAFYDFEVLPSARLTLSAQAIEDLRAATDTAVVLGARFVIEF